MTIRSQVKLGRFSYETEIIPVDKDIADKLNYEFNLGAIDARYHVDGTFYNKLERFPAVLFDLFGYVYFDNKDVLLRSFETEKLNIHRGIHALSGYIKYPHEPKCFINYIDLINSVGKRNLKTKEEKVKKFNDLRSIMLKSLENSDSSSILKV